MKVRNTMRVGTTLLAAMLALALWAPAKAQEQKGDHAVTALELRKDVEKAADARQANEAAVRQMFASDQAKDALKSAGIEYRQIDQAISQVSNEELARLAERSQAVNKDFAAGRLDDRDLLIILLVAVALILIIVAVH